MPLGFKMKKPNRKQAGAGGAVFLAAAAFLAMWEGTETKPYWDALGGEWTVCTGETNVEMREYTEEECEVMLAESLEQYAEEVRRVSPEVENHPYIWMAFISFSYNLGTPTYASSSVRRKFDAGDYIGACRAITLYNRAGGRVVRGLVFRREGEGQRIGEEELCMTGAILHKYPL